MVFYESPSYGEERFMSTIFTTIAKGVTSKPSEELTFAERSPKEYAMMLLQQAGITNLETLNSVFIGDPGFDVRVRERSFGRGVEFENAGGAGAGRRGRAIRRSRGRRACATWRVPRPAPTRPP